MSKEFTFIDRFLAYGVHLFTASGVMAAILAMIAIADSIVEGPHKLREAMIWLFIAFVIDGIDGTFARYFKTSEVLPNWDGKAIDYVIDFSTYAIIPAFFMYYAGIFPPDLNLVATFLILLISALYYGKDGMVSNDLYFVGFPVLWNAVAFYLYFVTDFTQMTNFVFMLIFCVLHFIPIKYPYPSRKNKMRVPTLLLSLGFFIINGFILYFFPQKIEWMSWISLAIIVAFSVISLYVSFSFQKSLKEGNS